METTYTWHDPELAALFEEVDEALAAYGRSIDAGLELSRGLIAACDGLQADLGELSNLQAQVEEWVV